MQLTRIAAVLTGVLMLAGCGSAQGGDPVGPVDPMAPTGTPVELAPLPGDGEVLTLTGGITITVPTGSVEVEQDAPDGTAQVTYRMPDHDPGTGLPAIQVTWAQDAAPAAVGDSFIHESTMVTNEAVSGYSRSAVTWPGATSAVVATWAEQVPTSADAVLVDGLLLWVDAPDGTGVQVLALAPAGAMAGSSAEDALRTLSLD